MTVTENLGALGSWEIQLSDETPDYILNQLGFFGHVAIADGDVDVEAVGQGLLTGARYVGVLRGKDKETGRKLSGSGMVFWLADEDKKGRVALAQLDLSGKTLAQAVTSILDINPSVHAGTTYTVAGVLPAGSKYQYLSSREILEQVCDAFNVEYRVNGNGTLDVGTAAQLYNTAAPDTIIVRKGAGADMDLVALGGDFTVGESVKDYTTKAVLVGQNIGSGDTPDEVFVTATAVAPSVPFLDLFGNQVEIVRLISESGTTTGAAPARAQLQLNRFNRVARSLKVTAEEYETEGNFVVGDNVYVYDPDTGIVNPANEVSFRGEVLHPDIVRASGITWPVVQGMTVAFRTQAGVWLDLTPFVTWESGGNELTVGDLPKSLTAPAGNPVQDRLDATRADASIPNAPTGLTLTTFSTLNAQGQTGAVIHAAWTAPSLNTDGSAIQDLSHYVVEYRWTARAPQWQQANATDLTEIDLIVVPGLPYQVRVTAYDLAGHPSDPSAIVSITSAADSIGPNPPADPVVTSYLGQLRIEYAGTDSSGNPMASDTNRIDVHVGTTVGFTATAATRVSSITPFAKGAAYATAPYGATRYVRLIAVDHSGNFSASSAVVSGATTQVAQGDVASVNVGSLVAGTMSADVVMAGRFTTALTGARREINAVGFQAYNASNVLTVNIDGVSNLLTGIFKTALTGRRVEIGASGSSGQMNFYAPDGTNTRVQSGTDSGGTEVLILSKVPSTSISPYWSSTIIGQDGHFHTNKYHSFAFGGGGGVGGFILYNATSQGTSSTFPTLSTRMSITPVSAVHFLDSSGGFFVYEHPASGADKLRLWIDGDGSNVLYHPQAASFQVVERNTAGNEYARLTLNSVGLYIYSNNASTDGIVAFWADRAAYMKIKALAGNGPSPTMQLVNNSGYGVSLGYDEDTPGGNSRLYVKDAGNVTYIQVFASNFFVASSESVKEDIRPLAAGSLDLVKAMRVTDYVRKPGQTANGEQDALRGRREIGLIAEEAPPEVRSEDGSMIDIYGTVSVGIASIQELAAIVEEQGNQIAALMNAKGNP